MKLNFSDVDECASFSISTKTFSKSQKAAGTMTKEINFEDKIIETREPNKEIAIQSDGFESTETKEYDNNELIGFLRSRMPLFENTFKEQKEIESTTGRKQN